jgi:hypothetical protein
MASFGLLVLGRQKSPDDRLDRDPIRHKRLLDGGNGVCGSVLGSLGVRAVGDYLLGSAIDAEREQSFVEGADAIKVRSVRAEWEMVGLAGDDHLSSWSALSPSLCILHLEYFAIESCLRSHYDNGYLRYFLLVELPSTLASPS